LRKLHNEELNLYCSPNIVLVIIENEMGGTCSAYGVEERRIQSFDIETTWEDQGVGERVILR